MSIDRAFLVWSLCYVIIGMLLGIFMAVSHDHGQHVTHAHILLVGFVLSLVYGVIHRLWLDSPGQLLVRVQFWLHQFGVLAMVTGLFLLYGNFVAEARLEPLLGIASIAVLLSAALMFWMVLRSGATRRPA